MALIDVTELLHDADFMDEIQIVSRGTAVNSLGENIVNESCRSAYGCVQPATGKALQRLPEALRIADVSSFWIQGNITISGNGKYPDILIWNEKRYQVQFVFDWHNWGPGLTEGTCIAESPVDQQGGL